MLFSKILFLDENYQPCGTRVIRRPNITTHIDRTDSKKIMAVGLGAFKDGDFDKEPQYWVPYEGHINNLNNINIKLNRSFSVWKLINKYFRFIAYHELHYKLERIWNILGIESNQLFLDFITSNTRTKDNQVVISLGGRWLGEEFSICDFLSYLQKGIDECSEAIEINRNKLIRYRQDMQFIKQIKEYSCPGIHINDNKYKFNKIILQPAYNTTVNHIRETKKRIQSIERQRSHIQCLKQHIFASIWYAQNS